MSPGDPLDEADVIDDGPSVDEDPVEGIPVDVRSSEVDIRDDDDDDDEEEAAPELVFGSVDEWMRRYWRFTYRRRVSAKGGATGRWRATYWESDEALQRLTALWRGWEASRQDPGLGTSAWWINHAEPQMAVLLSAEGPFAGATDESGVGDPLPYRRPPAGTFEPDRQPADFYDDAEY